MRVAVVSSVYGGYDVPHPPPEQDIPTEWVLVSDREYEIPPWRVVVEPRPQLHPRMAAKVAKARPDWYAGADIYVWVDANVQVTSPRFASWCVASLGEAALAVNPHPDAADLTAELGLTLRVPARYGGLPVREQVAAYLAEGFDEGSGNFWSNVMARSAACPPFGDAWLAEMTRWTYQDQLSLPVVLWRAGIVPALLDPRPGVYQLGRHGAEPVTVPPWHRPPPRLLPARTGG